MEQAVAKKRMVLIGKQVLQVGTEIVIWSGHALNKATKVTAMRDH